MTRLELICALPIVLLVARAPSGYYEQTEVTTLTVLDTLEAPCSARATASPCFSVLSTELVVPLATSLDMPYLNSGGRWTHEAQVAPSLVWTEPIDTATSSTEETTVLTPSSPEAESSTTKDPEPSTETRTSRATTAEEATSSSEQPNTRTHISRESFTPTETDFSSSVVASETTTDDWYTLTLTVTEYVDEGGETAATTEPALAGEYTLTSTVTVAEEVGAPAGNAGSSPTRSPSDSGGDSDDEGPLEPAEPEDDDEDYSIRDSPFWNDDSDHEHDGDHSYDYKSGHSSAIHSHHYVSAGARLPADMPKDRLRSGDRYGSVSYRDASYQVSSNEDDRAESYQRPLPDDDGDEDRQDWGPQDSSYEPSHDELADWEDSSSPNGREDTFSLDDREDSFSLDDPEDVPSPGDGEGPPSPDGREDSPSPDDWEDSPPSDDWEDSPSLDDWGAGGESFGQ